MTVSCQLCGKDFRTPSELNRHQLTHSGLKPFLCGCGKAYREKRDLVVHHRSVHTGNRPYQCDVCDKSFASSKVC
jgi:KRAB domain-containing zinc finger protein